MSRLTPSQITFIREKATDGLSPRSIARYLRVHETAVVPVVAEVACNKFRDWIKTAAPGDRFIYHSGNLGGDRRNDQTVAAIAKAALVAQRTGIASLCQRRRGRVIDYIIEKRASCLADNVRELTDLLTAQDMGRCGRSLSR